MRAGLRGLPNLSALFPLPRPMEEWGDAEWRELHALQLEMMADRVEASIAEAERQRQGAGAVFRSLFGIPPRT